MGIALKNNSITSRIMLPVVGIFAVSLIGLMVYIMRASEKNVVTDCERAAVATVTQFKQLRAYYTENVVQKVKAQTPLKVSYDHESNTNTIPLPATMIQDLSARLGKDTNNVQIKLYSAYPFPNRKDRKLDAFMQEAVAYFSTHAEGRFAKVTEEDGVKKVRVAIPDLMVAESCVKCHNTHADSPKKDWKLGDVRGVLEVETPIGAQLASHRAMAAQIGIVSIGCIIMMAGLVGWSVRRWVSRPIQNLMGVVEEASDRVSAASGQVTSSSASLASGASEQAASLEETSASLEEISSMTRRNADNAQSAKDLADQARTAADKGAADMQEMHRAMDDIKAAGDNIARIIKTIDEIAFQTNILALNAAIEAARAGEAGTGFAVVADEVKSLAQRSAGAARETAQKIEDSINKSQHGVELSSKVAASLTEIVDKARKVDELVAQIATASREQSQGIEQVNVAVTQVDKVTQSNAASAEESAGAAQELNSQAGALRQAVKQLLQLAGADNEMPPATKAHVAKSAPNWTAPAANGNGNGHGHGKPAHRAPHRNGKNGSALRQSF